LSADTAVVDDDSLNPTATQEQQTNNPAKTKKQKAH